MQFPLLQRFLFDLFISVDFLFGSELVQPVFALMMFFDPLPEFRIFAAQDPLNVGRILHRFSSLRCQIANPIVALAKVVRERVKPCPISEL
jgi:hypothetical protein